MSMGAMPSIQMKFGLASLLQRQRSKEQHLRCGDVTANGGWVARMQDWHGDIQTRQMMEGDCRLVVAIFFSPWPLRGVG